MSDQSWPRVEEIFHQAADLPPDQRPRFLDAACAGDPEIRRAVERLLAADTPEDNFLQAAVARAAEHIPDDEGADMVGQKLGLYSITALIGKGGMGAVYHAVREDDFSMEVAIKLLKRGMDTDAALARFRVERQILAWLQHPHIARLVDGGASPDGRPYFVMEYVEGQPITDYCETRKLGVRERLELFRTICSAVHYAHKNLVVHRDIKPGNILVTREGVPVVLDFGIAKILTDDPAGITVTMPAMRALTPEYCSPEQIRGEPITTACDVYSLGVLLYELLTAQRPYDFQTRTPEEVVAVICNQEPEKPSIVLRRGAAGQPGHQLIDDLDNIVLMAMHKEPQRRYASAEQLSEDIRRYLAGEPVIAHHDSTLYRAGKFVRRHKVGVLAGGVAALSLVSGTLVASWQAHMAAVERRRAEKRFDDVRKLANSMLFELHDGIRTLPGSTAVRELLLKRALEYLDSLASEADGNISFQRELATAYERVGTVQGSNSEPNVGQTKAALESYQKAVAIREMVVVAEPANRDARRELAGAYTFLGRLLLTAAEPDKALALNRRSLAIREELAKADPGDRLSRLQLANGYHGLASSLIQAGDMQGALQNRRQALAIYQELANADPNNPMYKRNLALGHKYLGGILASLRQYPESLKNYQAALAIDEARSAASSTNAEARMDVSFDMSDIGYVHWQLRQLREALSWYRKALAIREALAAVDSKDTRVRFAVANSMERIGLVLVDMAQPEAALRQYVKVLPLREQMVRDNAENVSHQLALALSYKLTADAHVSLAKSRQQKSWCGEARPWYRRALTTLDRLTERAALQGQRQDLSAEVKKALDQCDDARRSGT